MNQASLVQSQIQAKQIESFTDRQLERFETERADVQSQIQTKQTETFTEHQSEKIRDRFVPIRLDS